MAKDFRAAFNNMNQAVRPGGAGNVQPAASQPAAPVEKKMTAIERRSKLHGVQTYLTDEEYEMLMIAKIRLLHIQAPVPRKSCCRPHHS